MLVLENPELNKWSGELAPYKKEKLDKEEILNKIKTRSNNMTYAKEELGNSSKNNSIQNFIYETFSFIDFNLLKLNNITPSSFSIGNITELFTLYNMYNLTCKVNNSIRT